MNFDINRYVQKIMKILHQERIKLPIYNCNYSFAIINNVGTLFLIGDDGTIYRKLHMEVSMVSTKLNITLLNELLPTFNPFIVLLLVGNVATIDFSYCFKDIEENMFKTESDEIDVDNNIDLLRANPIFICRPLYFYYGEFEEDCRKDYPDSCASINGEIRICDDVNNIFEIRSNEQIHVTGRVYIRITGSRRLIHVTKDIFDDRKIQFVTKIDERLNHFKKWLQIRAFIHQDTHQDDGNYRSIIMNPIENIRYE